MYLLGHFTDGTFLTQESMLEKKKGSGFGGAYEDGAPVFTGAFQELSGKAVAKLLFTCSHELLDPSAGSLTKSQKLGLRASNSLRFTH
jgi:hypothetical protein